MAALEIDEIKIFLSKKLMSKQSKQNQLQNTPWNPFRDLVALEHKLEKYFGRIPSMVGNGPEEINESVWAPLTDILEDSKEFLVKCELPEVKKKDVKVTLENGTLRISGERRSEKKEKTRKYHRVERSYGSFERIFSLPDGADGGKVSAEFKDGLLTVRVPKTGGRKANPVEIKVD